jgi:hypothetical protein
LPRSAYRRIAERPSTAPRRDRAGAQARQLSVGAALGGYGGFDVMMQCCGTGMMVAGALAIVLGLVLLVSLIVLVWVAIGRLRRDRRPM